MVFLTGQLSRISEKQQLLTVPDLGENMAAVQSLLKKHDAFETDLSIHKGNCNDIVTAGQTLINEDNHHSEKIIQRCEQVKLVQM
jgi:spectrin alpha